MNEIIYSGRDNQTILELHSNSAVIDHTRITRVDCKFNGPVSLTVSSQTNPSYFDFTNAAKLVMQLGQVNTLITGVYMMRLIVYMTEAPHGIEWGQEIPVIVK